MQPFFFAILAVICKSNKLEILIFFLKVLLYHYGYSGCMLILGALMLNFSVSGALFRPLERRKTRVSTQQTVASLTEDIIIEQEENEHSTDEDREKKKTVDAESITTFSKNVPEGHKSNSFENGNAQVLNSYDELKQKEKNLCQRGCSACSESFDLPLLKHIPFVAYALLNCTVLMMNVMNSIFLASLADDKGFTVAQITVTIMVTNLAGIPVRAVTGIIMDHKLLRHRRVTVVGWLVFVVGVLTFCLPLVPGVAPTIAVWCVYEAVIGACECQQATFVADIVGPDRLTSAMGLLRMFAGFSALIGPVIGGR